MGQKLKSIHFDKQVILLITNVLLNTRISSGPVYSATILDLDPSKRWTLNNATEKYLQESYAPYQKSQLTKQRTAASATQS